MKIDWNFPKPRPGFGGMIDKFVGPGATRSEMLLEIIIPAIFAVAAPFYAMQRVENWSLIQYMLCGVIAFDIAGGVITNSTSSAKRWYHRPGQNFTNHIGFTSVHIFHLLLVSWLYLSFNITWVIVSGSYLLIAAVIILSVPRYLQRPVSLLCYSFGLLIAMYLLRQPEGLEWFLPLFYLKLLVSHLVTEEPYRP